jgi:hypothetical protein
LFASLFVTLREFAAPVRRAGEVRRLALVVVTDGEENGSTITFESLLEEARCRGVAVYAVVMQPEDVRVRARRDGRLRPGPDGVRRLSQETGAVAYFPRRPLALPGIAAAIADELSHQYALAYAPASGGPALRSVVVRVAGRAGLTVRTRTTYRLDRIPADRLGTR